MDTLRVTARRAEESVKDVPFTVTVIGGDTVEERGTTSLESTLMGTPGINIGSYGDANNANMKIRGVGSLNRIGGDDSSVVLYVDGMPDNVSGLSAQTLDVERLEILKGPQGTLFGRNSEAGAINLVSRKPTDVLEGYVRGELGTGMYRLTEGAISGPIVGTLKGRFAFRYNGEDLWVDNARDGEPLTKPEDLTARGTLQWDPTDLTSLTVVASREVLTDHPGFMVLRPYGESPVMDVPPGSIVDEKWSSRISAEVTHTLPFAVATVFSGYTRMDWKTGGPFYEGRLYDTLIGMTPDSTRTVMIGRNVFNQELRLSSRPEEKVFWVAGANYYRSDWRSSNRDSFDAFYPTNPFNADIDRDYETESYALFGEVTVPVTESLKVTAGVRQTWEHKTYDAVWRATASNPSTLRVSRDKQELDDDYITGRLAFGYDVTPDLTVHGVYARGYKSGGWGDHGSNISMGLSDAPYDAAIVDSYELGMKSDFLDGDLTVNGALFWNTTRNDHLMLFDTTTFTTQARNFDTESKGIELEAAWRLGHGFTLGGSLAYTDASITGVPANSGTDVQVGNKVPHVPEWGWTLSLTHMMDLPERLIPLLPVRSTYRR
ncbi:TonB-dependent receptor [Roseospira visakhapatnamensis]|uniref:Iron complex outermembrane receptor protein n=1 Tax=Roseospira visakhapatnamensis TaxID=390880 RepID=A0A7W6WAC4_9PROT|nr:TonB-dependent receptor [Roseospira visakhapatnamensis]MBB4267050.1 iron complex outermembrane receptor protein [Roseospira visakhapatnamensis]